MSIPSIEPSLAALMTAGMVPTNSLATSINAPGLIGPASLQSSPVTTQQISFEDALGQALQAMNSSQVNAQQQIERSLTGDDLSLVETFSAAREADLALKMMIQVRNKLVEAFRDVQNIQL